MAVIALFQVPIIVRKQRWRELAVFSALWLVALVYALLIAGRAATQPNRRVDLPHRSIPPLADALI